MTTLPPSVPDSALARTPSATLPPYLFKRGTTYYFKRRIPADCRDAMPDSRGQVWKSLDTGLLEKAKVRRVPVHEQLLRCGFLTYVEEQRAAGHQRLFPSQRNANKHGIWSNAVGKWFGRYLRSIGLDDSRLCFHSFRSNFKLRCSLSGIETEVRDALTGHWVSRSDSARGYVKVADRQYPYAPRRESASAARWSTS